MNTNERVDAVRVGRNYIRAGDAVHVKPSSPGKRDGGTGKVHYIEVRPDESIDHFCVTLDGRTRCLRPERIARMAQTRARQAVKS